MRQAKAGYTIVEVMIVLAISSILLISAIAMFKGKRGGTEFTQAMYDINSKIQSYVSDVGVGLFPDSENYTCSSASGKATLTLLGSGTQDTGTNQDCIFLGKAMLVGKDTASMSTYTVLGNRTKTAGAQTVPVVTYDDAKPTPVMLNNLIENYAGSFSSAELVWSRVNTTTDPAQLNPTETDLVGFYNSLQGDNNPVNQTGGQSLLAKAYPSYSGNVQACIEEQASCKSIDIKGWYMCFKSRNSGDSAILVFSSAPTGVTSRIVFKDNLTAAATCPG